MKASAAVRRLPCRGAVRHGAPRLLLPRAHAEGNRTVKAEWMVEYFIPHELHVSGWAAGNTAASGVAGVPARPQAMTRELLLRADCAG